MFNNIMKEREMSRRGNLNAECSTKLIARFHNSASEMNDAEFDIVEMPKD